MTDIKELTLYEELLKNKTVLPGITDIVFKHILLRHKDYLALILEKILPLSKEQIEKGEFKNIELPPNHIEMKASRMDLYFQVDKYDINIEANSSITNALLIRNQAHFAGMIWQEYTRPGKKELDEILYQIAINKTKRLTSGLMVKMKLWDQNLDVGEEKLKF